MCNHPIDRPLNRQPLFQFVHLQPVYSMVTILLLIFFSVPEISHAQMGFFLAMLLFINMLTALTLHPLLLLLVKSKFIKKAAAARQVAAED